MMRISSEIRTASLFGILSAITYSLEHPFSKAFVEQFDNPIVAGAFATAISESIGILLVACLMLNTQYRRKLVALFRADGALQKRLILALLTSARMVAYYFAITQFNAVTVATILNIFPLYLILVSAVMKWEKVESTTLFLFAGVAIFMVATQGQFANDLLGGGISISLISLVPILFAIGIVYQSKVFGDRDPLVYVTASSAFDAPIAIFLALLVLRTQGAEFSEINFESLPLLMFAIATFSGLFLGRYLLQRGREVKREAFVSVWFFLVPVFTGTVGHLLNTFILKTNSQFDYENTVQILGLTIALVLLLLINEEKRKRSA